MCARVRVDIESLVLMTDKNNDHSKIGAVRVNSRDMIIEHLCA
jgi:hypothetical protein